MRLRAFSGLYKGFSQQRYLAIMTEKHLKRGTSVQILQPGLPMLVSEDLNFAESFATFSVKSKKFDQIKEEETSNDSVIDVIKTIMDLKDRSISTLTLERLVKQLTDEYEPLLPDDKLKLFIYLATKHFINEDELRYI